MSYRNFVKWTDDEIACLFDGLRMKKTVGEIALAIKKSESAVEFKIREYLHKRWEEQQESLETLAVDYNMTVEKVRESLEVSENTSNRGQKWGEAEINQLLREVYEKLSIEDIALIHKRTVLGIRCRLMEMAADYHYNENRSMKSIIKFTGLSEEEVIEAIGKRAKKEVKKEVKSEKLSSLLRKELPSPSDQQDILSKLDVIERKLDLILSKLIF